MSSYTIISSVPTTYNDPERGIVNGVLVKVRLQPYNEVHDLRVPEMNVTLVKAAADKLLAERDALQALNNPGTESTK